MIRSLPNPTLNVLLIHVHIRNFDIYSNVGTICLHLVSAVCLPDFEVLDSSSIEWLPKMIPNRHQVLKPFLPKIFGMLFYFSYFQTMWNGNTNLWELDLNCNVYESWSWKCWKFLPEKNMEDNCPQMHSHILQTPVDLMVIPKKRFKFFFLKTVLFSFFRNIDFLFLI